MQSVEDRLNEIANDLREGKEPTTVTVREFLSWFSSQRRGYWIVKWIRDFLEKASLCTEPDFESAYIDSVISFSLLDEVATEEAPSENSAEAALTLPSITCIAEGKGGKPTTYADPTYRISKLAAANRTPFCVNPDASVQEAVTIMLANDFSQIPVMTSEREGLVGPQSVPVWLLQRTDCTSRTLWIRTKRYVLMHPCSKPSP